VRLLPAILTIGLIVNLAATATAGDPVVVPQQAVEGPVLSCCPAGPPPVACWAKPSRTKAYVGYYVGGGGAVCHPEPRGINEGTWGWDYQGCLLPRNVWLRWNHGRLYQGGPGAYKVDGPPVPNVLAVPPLPHRDGGEH
jgi:hypothetical protein